MDLLTDLAPPHVIALAFGVGLLGGFVKGAIGFALPLILVSGLSTIMDPRLAIAGLVVPTVVTNLFQAMRTGPSEAMSAIRDFWRLILAACAMVFVVTQFVPAIPPRILYLCVGIPVLALSAIQLAGVPFRVAPHLRRTADVAVGVVAGGIGGLAGTPGPAVVLYLIALRVKRSRQLTVQGVVYTLGSLALVTGHVQSGLLNRETLPLSVALLVPVGAGMVAGLRAGGRLDAILFRRATLVVLAVAGANLIRKGIFAL